MTHVVTRMILAIVFYGVPVLSAFVAHRRGRSVIKWLVVTIPTNVIGLGVLLALPRLVPLSCPRCAEPRGADARVCAHCGSVLPEPEMAARLMSSGEQFDCLCPSCSMPYRPSDYDLNAEHIYCSSCRAELPRALS